MKEKFTSRKFWIMMGSVVALLVAEFTGYSVSPEALAGLGAVVVTWLGGQSFVDKAKVTEETKVAGDIAKAQAIMYAKSLETQLANMTNELEVQKAAVKLTAVPEDSA